MTTPEDAAAVSLNKIAFSYPAGPPVLRDADLTVPVGRRTALLGANGSGKSTLLRCLSGALRPTAGSVRVRGELLRHTPAGLRRHRRMAQLVLQDPDDQLFSASVAQDVSFGPLNLRLGPEEVRARVDGALELMSVSHLRDRPTHLLSFGERKRIAICGAVAMRPEILALDEPTAGLDPVAVEETLAALERLHRAGTTVILATHDVDLALRWADDVAVMQAGGVRQGPAAELLADCDLLARARLTPPWLLEVSGRLTDLGLLGAGCSPRTARALLDALPVPDGPAPRRPPTRGETLP
ncbi:MAG: cobalt/nickel transport system ATP-binding protein [Actinomycetota bacterium]|nr:cobalt/nickel transport system ATP-binding protein [Actinomycetota bacterium]